MQRIDVASAVSALPVPEATGTPGYFGRGGSGALPTSLTADWANLIQEEIIAPIAAAGIELDKTNAGQLLAALRAMFAPIGGVGRYAGYASAAGAITIPIANSGFFYEFTGAAAATWTLPAPTAAAQLTIANAGTAALTFATPSGAIKGGTGTIQAGVSVELASDGTNWAIVGGQAAVQLGASGYRFEPNGLMEQWGTVAVSDDGYVAVTFPTPFPTASYNPQATPIASGAVTGQNAIGSFVGGLSLTGMSVGHSEYAASYSTSTSWSVKGH